MRPHKFEVGAVVDYHAPYTQLSRSSDRFVVQRHLPPDGQGNLYRLESRLDGRQRVAHEAELTPVEALAAQ
ncbi:MAG: hypothetical protein FJX55_02140 [Alphaproteobacteria bacterium]|nr:hypothetical protein [Alphaproteobacteria bacterium]